MNLNVCAIKLEALLIKILWASSFIHLSIFWALLWPGWTLKEKNLNSVQTKHVNKRVRCGKSVVVRSQHLCWPSVGTFYLTLQFFKHLRQRASDSHPLVQCSTRPPPLIQHSSDASLHISSDIKALKTTYFHYRINTSISKLFLTLLSLLCPPPPPPSSTHENYMEDFENKWPSFEMLTPLTQCTSWSYLPLRC